MNVSSFTVGDSISAMRAMSNGSVDFVLADPPYSSFPLINDAITEGRRVSKGASAYFMYGEDVFDLEQRPDRLVYWVKPVSTKNTTKSFSRFVEVVALYDTFGAVFNSDNHWSVRTGVFTDSLTYKQRHPFEKPESLIEKLLCVFTNEGDLVLDPFAGSGTTGRVAARMGRGCISIEIDEAWVPLWPQKEKTIHGNATGCEHLLKCTEGERVA